MELLNLHHFFLQLRLGHQEAADGEEARDAGDAGHVAPGIVMAEDHMAGDGHGQHLQDVGRGGVDEHPHKLQPHHDGQQVVQHMPRVRQILRVHHRFVNFRSQTGD